MPFANAAANAANDLCGKKPRKCTVKVKKFENFANVRQIAPSNSPQNHLLQLQYLPLFVKFVKFRNQNPIGIG
jgi:hypothetical protein